MHPYKLQYIIYNAHIIFILFMDQWKGYFFFPFCLEHKLCIWVIAESYNTYYCYIFIYSWYLSIFYTCGKTHSPTGGYCRHVGDSWVGCYTKSKPLLFCFRTPRNRKKKHSTEWYSAASLSGSNNGYHPQPYAHPDNRVRLE